MTTDKLSTIQLQGLAAVKKGDFDTLKKLLDLGLDINTSNSFNENLLYIACELGHRDIALYLLANQANVFQKNSGNRSVLNAAYRGGNVAIIQAILQLCEQQGYSELKATMSISYCFSPKNSAAFLYFLDAGQVTENDIKELSFRHFKDISLILEILDRIFSKFPTLNTALDLFQHFIQSIESRIEVLAFILKRFPEIKSNFTKFYTALIYAFARDSQFPERIIHSAKSEVINHLYFDIWNVTNPALEFLLKNGLKPNDLDDNGLTLLHHVAFYQFDEYEDVSLLKKLLDLGYPINALNKSGQTPLQTALEQGMLSHAVYLIYRGADVNVSDAQGRNCLDYAINFIPAGSDEADEKSRELLIKILKDYGAQ